MPKQRLYRVKWSWNKCKNMDNFVKTLCVGKTLNFPCGMSRIGNTRADIDSSVKPDVIADIKNPETWPTDWFKHPFDTLICDPPYSFYNRFRWTFPLRKIAVRRIAFSTPLTCLDFPMKSHKKEYFIAESNNGHFLRLWQIFDKIELTLGEQTAIQYREPRNGLFAFQEIPNE